MNEGAERSQQLLPPLTSPRSCWRPIYPILPHCSTPIASLRPTHLSMNPFGAPLSCACSMTVTARPFMRSRPITGTWRSSWSFTCRCRACSFEGGQGGQGELSKGREPGAAAGPEGRAADAPACCLVRAIVVAIVVESGMSECTVRCVYMLCEA